MSEIPVIKIHQRKPDYRWVVLDQNGTPFWWASFDTEAEAHLAWDAYKTCLRNAATTTTSQADH
jgi:hypothetical protein